MVKIIDYKVRTNKVSGEEFCTLTISGGVEIIKSRNTGRQYASIRKCSIPASFEESTCKGLVGTEFTGRIEKFPCEDYDITDSNSGEIITLNFNYEYVNEADSVEETILEPFSI